MGDGTTVTKAEFAALCKVDKTRVSHWIREGKLKGKALIGNGRNARIDVEEAQRQLRITLDSGQRLGNGLGTKLNRKPTFDSVIDPDRSDAEGAGFRPNFHRTLPPQSIDAGDPDDLLDDALDAEIKREKLVQLQRANRKGAEDEAAAQGRYTDTMAVRRQMGILVVQTMRVFEGAVPEMATTIASRFAIDEREVLQTLSDLFRTIRAHAADKAKSNAEALPILVSTGAEPDPEA